MLRLRGMILGLISAGALLGTIATGGIASAANYGSTAQYQVEISANCNGSTCPLPSGVWLWIELDSDGTGYFNGADCVHAPGTPLPGTQNGAAALADSGPVTWSDMNGELMISGVKLLANTVPFAVTVPDTIGHYVLSTSDVLSSSYVSLPPGQAQVQVAT